MRKYILAILSVFVILTLAATVSAAELENTTIPGLNTTTDVYTAIDLAENQNRTLAIIFDQDSCMYCDMFKEDVLSNPEVQNVLNEKFIVLISDIHDNPDLAVEYGIYGTPSVQFVDSTGREILKIEGYCDSEEFLQAIKEI